MADSTFENRMNQVRKTLQANNARRAIRRVGVKTDKSIFQGQKRGLVILVNFQDVKFQDGHDAALYTRLLNEKGFDYSETSKKVDASSTQSDRTYKFDGSVQDYFRDQSLGQFELDFDVVGPVTVSKNRAYYGGTCYTKVFGQYIKKDNDANAAYMVQEALALADKAGVDFSQYDWDNDGTVDQVFCLYAGQGEADGGDSYCIWPHEWTLSAAGKSKSSWITYYYDDGGKYVSFKAPSISAQKYDGKTVDTYACSNELGSLYTYDSTTKTYPVWGTIINGIGTFCHEFSHCMGFPDMYDTSNSGYYGMNSWDLMDYGSYSGNNMGYKPTGYTSWERWMCGWSTPTVLSNPEKITNMPSLQSSGKSYIVYARGSDYTGEYYLLENRQWDGWDYMLPYHGLLIIHGDYNATSFNNNSLNTTSHQRMTVFHAGNDDSGYMTFTDIYPYDYNFVESYVEKNFNSNYNSVAKLNASSLGITLNTSDNNGLTTSTTPAATYYNGGSSESSFADHEIHDIEDNADGTVNFIYRYPTSLGTLALDETVTTAPTFTKGYYGTATLNRTLKAGTWSTMWLPFSLSQGEAKTAFGDDVALARLNGFANNSADVEVLRFDDANSPAIYAYQPFLIKVGSDKSSLSFSNVQVEASQTPTVTNGNTSFVGTTSYGTIPSGDFFLSGNKYYQSTGSSKLRAYRAYIATTASAKSFGSWEVATPEVTEPVEYYREPSELEAYLNIVGDTPTGITTVGGSSIETANQKIYNLNGQYVGTDAKSLKRGIYVIGGKKRIVK